MKAAVYHQNGGPEVFSYADVADPACPDDGLLIEVEVISVEGGDLVNREFGALTSIPHVVGYQCSGVVRQQGALVSGHWVGKRVVSITASGAYAELVVASPSQTWVVPDGLAMGLAAAIPVAFGTASECLFAFGGLKAGERVLIHAGAGAVGLAAIQLAKRAGAIVFATASSNERLDRLREYGLDVPINYAADDFVERVKEETNGRGVELVIDSVGGANLTRSVAALAYRGRAVFVGIAGRDPGAGFDPLCLWERCNSVQGFFFPSALPAEHQRCYAVVAGMLKGVAAGDLHVVIDRTLALRDAGEAHRHVMSRQAFGRVLLRP